MNRELGIAPCGLACCLCSENKTCPGCRDDGCRNGAMCENRLCCREKYLDGCWQCGETSCRRGLLAKNKPYAFTLFIRRYGLDALLDRLEQKEAAGVVYHRQGITGDYDGFDDPDALVHFILNGTQEAQP